MNLVKALWSIWSRITWRERGRLLWLVVQILPYLPLIVLVFLIANLQPASKAKE